MNINRHTAGINIRSIGTGVLAVILLLAFLNPFGAIGMLIQSSVILLISFIMIIVGQIMVIKFKQEADSSSSKKKREKVYSIIGISLILLVIFAILLMAFITSIAAKHKHERKVSVLETFCYYENT
jgi:L-asparagine transporter-like permease